MSVLRSTSQATVRPSSIALLATSLSPASRTARFGSSKNEPLSSAHSRPSRAALRLAGSTFSRPDGSSGVITHSPSLVSVRSSTAWLNFHARSRSRPGGAMTTAPSSRTLCPSGRVSVSTARADTVITARARSFRITSADAGFTRPNVGRPASRR